MTKVYPKPITPFAALMLPKSSAAGKVFTVWKKSLFFNCDGFTLFDSNDNLVFRVDNYVVGGNGAIVLMDASGHPLLTIRRKEAKGGTVALGVDVFCLVVQHLIDPAIAMALVIVLDQMFGSSRRVL
ncbi:hypothetical protein L6452_02096 [Arctium lappa]|uniref:Uncharacterized protein n=1 Tax=Arctium lappa TaxID=4217 RepID=A0ACB9FHX7_ARCLA|nr:hypothetical protein L6452_02096 [Arctium lappa]